MTILTMPAGLFDIFMIYLWHRTSNGLTISNARSANIGLNAKFTQHTVNKNIKVQFTHARDDCLARVFIRTNTESRILFCQFTKGFAHLFLIRIALRLNGNGNHRLRERNIFKNYFFIITKRIACKSFLQAQNCTNITSTHLHNIFAAVSMHADQAANTFPSTFRGVIYHLPLANSARIHTEVSQTAHVRISNYFENQRTQRRIIIRRKFNVFASVVNSMYRWNLSWRGKVIHNSIQQYLHTFILQRRTTKNRSSFTIYDRPSQSRFHFRNADLLPFQVSDR